MKVLVINGSPKGDYSITLQTSLYIERMFQEHTFEIINVAQKIKQIEKDIESIIQKISGSDLVIFSYPVYTFLAPSQLQLFISILKKANVSFKNTYATQITTSKHFYDYTAHEYLKENLLDLNFKYLDGLSADMEDLLIEKGQEQAVSFFKLILWQIKNGIYLSRDTISQYNKPLIDASDECEEIDKSDKTVIIVTDALDTDENLRKMISRFQKRLPFKSEIFNINEYNLKGGCLGCLNCAVNGKCIYKDGFDEYLRKEIQTKTAIIYAFRIKDHSMGPVFKMYDDRQFCNGHRTVTMGSPTGYIISGRISAEKNLELVIKGRSEVGSNYLAGIATDEENPNESIDLLVNKLTYAIENKLVLPQNFLGVGGMKIFRDLIYLTRGMMKADHKFFKTHKQYDFPQKKKGESFKMYLVGFLLSSPKIKAKMGNKFNEGMIAPYKKVINKQ